MINVIKIGKDIYEFKGNGKFLGSYIIKVNKDQLNHFYDLRYHWQELVGYFLGNNLSIFKKITISNMNKENLEVQINCQKIQQIDKLDMIKYFSEQDFEYIKSLEYINKFNL